MEESSTTSPHKKTKVTLDESDRILQIFERYRDLDAPESDLILETAKAIRNTIDAKSQPPTPLYYFLGVVSQFHRNRSDEDVDVLSWILAIVLPQVSEKAEVMSKAVEAVEILGRGVHQLSMVIEMGFRVVECLGQLLLDVCDCDPKDWESLRLGFDTLLELSFTIDPKVRKFAQDCVVKLFKTFKSCDNKTRASKWVSASLIAGCSRITDDEVLALQMLELLKLLLPCFPSDLIYEEFFLKIHNCLSTLSNPMYLLDVSEAILEFLESESNQRSKWYIPKIPDKWKTEYYSVAAKIAECLDSREEEATCARASGILLEVFMRVAFFDDAKDFDGEEKTKESEIFCFFCDALSKALGTFPNKHLLDIIASVFGRLGRDSDLYMSEILLKLADFMSQTFVDDTLDAKHLRDCIGCAVWPMGEDTLQELIPIEFDTNSHSCSNPWMISILKGYNNFSSMGFFVETIVPLAKSVEEACQKIEEKESLIKEELESLARDLWGTLPAFCRQPVDLEESFGPLMATIVIPHIQKDSLVLESVAIALQYLVKQCKDLSSLMDDEDPCKYLYDEKTAPAKMAVISSWSEKLFKAFCKVFFQVSADKRAIIKETIECLSLITESSTVKKILLSNFKEMKSVAERSLILELAPSSIGAANMDFTNILYSSCIEEWLKVEDDKSLGEAYDILHKILNEYPELMSSKFYQLVDLLLGLRSPNDTTYGRENKHGDSMLKEILNNYNLENNKERMHVACSIIVEIGSSLKRSSTGLYHVFIRMIMSCLSVNCGDPTRSGAVNALSDLIAKDTEICKSMPELVFEIIAFLDTQIGMLLLKAVLNFLTVLVTYLHEKELKRILSYILGGLLPLTSSWRYNAICELQVTSILGILVDKCGSASVKSIVCPFEKSRFC